jgi:hypothetical protein
MLSSSNDASDFQKYTFFLRKTYIFENGDVFMHTSRATKIVSFSYEKLTILNDAYNYPKCHQRELNPRD